MLDWQDDIVGCATAAGDGCRSILRVAGPNAHDLIFKSLQDVDPPPWKNPRSRKVVARIHDWRRTVEGTLVAWPEGRSSTGQHAAELHLPAGPALIAAIQEQLVRSGARLAKRGEFTLRAFLAGKLDLAQAEGVLGLVEAVDPRQLAFAVDRRTGGLSRRIAALRCSLLDFLADVEASLDFVEEDIQFVDRSGALRRLEEAVADLQRLHDEQGRRTILSGRPTIVLMGPPNAGKSTLFNALIGAATAITSPEPGATRDVLAAPATIGGHEVELFDTAGVDAAAEAVHDVYGQAGELRERSVQAASLVVRCLPVRETAGEDWTPTPQRILVRTQADRDPSFRDSNADCTTSVFGPPGLEELIRVLCGRLGALTSDAPAGIAERSAESLRRALDRLEESKREFHSGGGLELLAAGLRLALDDLGEIVGAVYTNDLLDRIFSRFCIGK